MSAEPVPPNPLEAEMKRRTVDILVPLVYVLAVLVAVFIGEEGGIGGVATLGAIVVAVYYLTLRQNIKA